MFLEEANAIIAAQDWQPYHTKRIHKAPFSEDLVKALNVAEINFQEVRDNVTREHHLLVWHKKGLWALMEAGSPLKHISRNETGGLRL